MMNRSLQMNSSAYWRFTQIVVGLAGAAYLLIGIALLFAPGWFFSAIGNFQPFNRHYEGDLGSFLLPLGIGLLVAARDPARYIWVIRVAASAVYCMLAIMSMMPCSFRLSRGRLRRSCFCISWHYC